MWILRADHALSALGDASLPDWLGKIRVPLPYLLGIGWFRHHPRVVQAWVSEVLSPALSNFKQLKTVRDRSNFVDLPVRVDGQLNRDFRTSVLPLLTGDAPVRIAIVGQGGTGKTSLACQLALSVADQRSFDEPAVPILLEDDLDDPDSKEDLLLTRITAVLQSLLNDAFRLPSDFVQLLLARGRILLVVDRFSELSEVSRNAIQAGIRRLPIRAAVLTSRSPELARGIEAVRIQPLALDGRHLLRFLSEYLSAVYPSRSVTDHRLSEAQRRLSRMIGSRTLSAGLARLFADHVATDTSRGSLPSSPLELVGVYIDDLNLTLSAQDRRDAYEVHSALRTIAWECTRERLRPMPASTSQVLLALNENDPAAALPLLNYAKRLGLVRSGGPGHERVRFELDFVAEHLAAHYCALKCGTDEGAWDRAIERIDELRRSHNEEPINGFVVALRDAVAPVTGWSPTSKVPTKLNERAEDGHVAIDEAYLNERVRVLVGDLTLPDARDRESAAARLRELGSAARDAAAALLLSLTDEAPVVSNAAAAALIAIGPPSELLEDQLAVILQDERPAVRLNILRVARALPSLGPSAAPTLARCLTDPDAEIQGEAAAVLHEMGVNAASATETVESIIRSGDSTAKERAVRLLGRISEGAAADLRLLWEALNSPLTGVQVAGFAGFRALGARGASYSQRFSELIATSLPGAKAELKRLDEASDLYFEPLPFRLMASRSALDGQAPAAISDLDRVIWSLCVYSAISPDDLNKFEKIMEWLEELPDLKTDVESWLAKPLSRIESAGQVLSEYIRRGGVQRTVALALIEGAGSRAIEVLDTLLADDLQPEELAKLSSSLGEEGIRRLMNATRGASRRQATNAALALGYLGDPPDAVIASLLESCSANPSAASACLRSISRLAQKQVPLPRGTFQGLLDTAASGSADVVIAALEGMADVLRHPDQSSQGAWEFVGSAARSNDPAVRAAAATCIGDLTEIGLSANPAVRSQLATLLRDGTEMVRSSALRATGAIANTGEEIPKEAVNELLNLIEQETSPLRLQGLVRAIPPSQRSTDLLERLIPTIAKRSLTRIMLIRHLAGAPQILRALREMLADETVERRLAAAEILGAMGTRALSAVPDLERAKSDREANVRRAATDALNRIGD